MKSIKTFVAVIAMAASFASFAAETVTATASTMDGAEAKIAAQAQAAADLIPLLRTQFFIVMGLVDAIPMIAVGLGLYVMFAVA